MPQMQIVLKTSIFLFPEGNCIRFHHFDSKFYKGWINRWQRLKKFHTRQYKSPFNSDILKQTESKLLNGIVEELSAYDDSWIQNHLKL